MKNRYHSVDIILACFNVLISAIVFAFVEDASLMHLAWISFGLFFVLLLLKMDNLLFFARTLFLGGIGYYPMLIKVIAGQYAFFSLYEFGTQGYDIVVVMYFATSLALLGNEIGLLCGNWKTKYQEFLPSVYFQPSSLWKTVFWLSILGVLWSSYVTIQSSDSVLTRPYGSPVNTQLLGNTQNIGIICLLAMLVGAAKLRMGKKGFIVVFVMSIWFLLWAMFLRGLRQDVVTALMSMAVCYGLIHRKTFRITPKSFFYIFIVVLIVEMMGVARVNIATQGIHFRKILDTMYKITFEQSAFHFGTVSPIATTFSNMIYLINSGILEPALGKSYLEFILRTPPEFLYPDRPKDYAWIFSEYGLGATGGFFELAEAYMNFGLLGTFMIPAVISFLMAKAFYRALYRQTVLSYFLLFTFLGIFLRGTWYQTFAFYKSFWTSIILFGCFLFIHQVAQVQDGAKRRKEDTFIC